MTWNETYKHTLSKELGQIEEVVKQMQDFGNYHLELVVKLEKLQRLKIQGGKNSPKDQNFQHSQQFITHLSKTQLQR
jgi:hypothetical protein